MAVRKSCDHNQEDAVIQTAQTLSLRRRKKAGGPVRSNHTKPQARPSSVGLAATHHRRLHGHFSSQRNSQRKQSGLREVILRQLAGHRAAFHILPRISFRDVDAGPRLGVCVHPAASQTGSKRREGASSTSTFRRGQVAPGKEKSGIWNYGAKSVWRGHYSRMEPSTEFHWPPNQSVPKRKTSSAKMVSFESIGSAIHAGAPDQQKLPHGHQKKREGGDHSGENPQEVTNVPSISHAGTRVCRPTSNPGWKLEEEEHTCGRNASFRPCCHTNHQDPGQLRLRGRSRSPRGRVGKIEGGGLHGMDTGHEQKGQKASQAGEEGIGHSQGQTGKDQQQIFQFGSGQCSACFTTRKENFQGQHTIPTPKLLPCSPGETSIQGHGSDGNHNKAWDTKTLNIQGPTSRIFNPSQKSLGEAEQSTSYPIIGHSGFWFPSDSNTAGHPCGDPSGGFGDSNRIRLRRRPCEWTHRPLLWTTTKTRIARDMVSSSETQTKGQERQRIRKEDDDGLKKGRVRLNVDQNFKIFQICFMMALFLGFLSMSNIKGVQADPTASFTQEGQVFIAQKIIHVPIDLPFKEIQTLCKKFYDFHYAVHNQYSTLGKERWFTLIRLLERPCVGFKLMSLQFQNVTTDKKKRGLFLTGLRILKTVFGKFDVFDLRDIGKLIGKIPWLHTARMGRLHGRMNRMHKTLSKFDKTFSAQRITWTWRKLFSDAVRISARAHAIQEGLRLARHGKLSTGLVNSTTAALVLRVVTDHLKKERGTDRTSPPMVPIAGSPVELYDCPVSIIMTNQEPRLLIHVPIATEKMDLHQFVAIPFMLQDKPRLIKPDRSLLAISRTSQMSLNAEQLARCWKIRPRHWVCHHSMPLFAKDKTGCLSAIKASNPTSIVERCRIEEIKNLEVAQLRDSFILYSSKELTLTFQCPHQETKTEAGVKGLAQRPFKPGCRVSTEDFKLWQPEEMLLPASLVIDVNWHPIVLPENHERENHEREKIVNLTLSQISDNLVALDIAVPLNMLSIGMIAVALMVVSILKFRKRKQPQPPPILRPLEQAMPEPPSPILAPPPPPMLSFRTPPRQEGARRKITCPPYQAPLPTIPSAATIKARAQALRSADNIYAATEAAGDANSTPRVLI